MFVKCTSETQSNYNPVIINKVRTGLSSIGLTEAATGNVL